MSTPNFILSGQRLRHHITQDDVIQFANWDNNRCAITKSMEGCDGSRDIPKMEPVHHIASTLQWHTGRWFMSYCNHLTHHLVTQVYRDRVRWGARFRMEWHPIIVLPLLRSSLIRTFHHRGCWDAFCWQRKFGYLLSPYYKHDLNTKTREGLENMNAALKTQAEK